MEIKVELFASPFLSFHSNSSSGVICYSMASHKLLWEHHSWDDYLDRSHSAEWLQSIFVSLKSTDCSVHSRLVLQAADDFADVLALIALCDQTVGRRRCARCNFSLLVDGRLTVMVLWWKEQHYWLIMESWARGCKLLTAVLDCVYLMRISSVTAKLPAY